MWNIGFIENINEDFLDITYSHVDQIYLSKEIILRIT